MAENIKTRKGDFAWWHLDVIKAAPESYAIFSAGGEAGTYVRRFCIGLT